MNLPSLPTVYQRLFRLHRLGLVLVIAISVSSRPANASEFSTLPRLGEFYYDSWPNQSDDITIWAADTDEDWKEIIYPKAPATISFFNLPEDGLGYGQPPIDGLTQAPHDFDTDWVYAIAITSGEDLLFYFQTRIAGSAMTISNGSIPGELANIFATTTAQNSIGFTDKWTNHSDYFEFPYSSGIVLSSEEETTGPNSFFSTIFPEPTSLAILLIGVCLSPMRVLRRSK